MKDHEGEALTGRTAEDAGSASQQPLAEAFAELTALHRLFEAAPTRELPQLYARCIPWLSQVRTHTKPPLAVEEITALTREVDYHLRSLAGLGMGGADKKQDHSASALEGLQKLASRVAPR